MILRLFVWLLAKRGGNTTLQTTLTVAGLAVLTGTTAPTVQRYLAHAKVLRAEAEVKIIASAIHLFLNDMGTSGVPASPGSRECLEMLVSGGSVPVTSEGAGSGWTKPLSDPSVGLFDDYLITNAPGFTTNTASTRHSFNWEGPYLRTPVKSDPWGNRYAASVGVMAHRRGYLPVIVSAGPDGDITFPYRLTPEQMVQVFGDDVHFVLD